MPGAGRGGLGGLAGCRARVGGVEPFGYALIRVVPRVERRETMNAGVMLCSQRHGYLDCRIRLDGDRLRALDPGG